jgi:hypothetical protein
MTAAARTTNTSRFGRGGAGRGAAIGEGQRRGVGTAALKDHFVTLSTISHNPPPAALSRSITEIRTGLAVSYRVATPANENR